MTDKKKLQTTEEEDAFAKSIGAMSEEEFGASIGATNAPMLPAPAFKSPLSGNPAMDVGIGMTKGLSQTGVGIMDLTRLSKVFPDAAEVMRAYSETQNPWQSFGKGVEQVGEYFAPGGLVTKAKGLISARTLMGRMIRNAALEGASQGAVSAAQTGGDPKTTMFASLFGAAGAGTGTALESAAGTIGSRILRKAILPTATDLADGFKLETLKKYRISGGLEKMLSQTIDRLETVRRARAQLFDPKVTVNINGVFAGAKQDMLKMFSNGKMFASSDDALGEINRYTKALDDITSGTGNVTLEQAENIKEAIGDFGAWYHYPIGKKEGPQNAQEWVANYTYRKVKAFLESVTPPGELKAYNETMMELIPVRRALIRRIPVEQRQALFSLSDIAATIPAAFHAGPSGMLFLAASKAQKMPTVGSYLYQNAQSPSNLVTALSRGAQTLFNRPSGNE